MLGTGQTFAGHVVTGRLGRGAMGTVYRARDPSGREVALKVLSGGRRAADARERFLREAELTARLVHPHVVRVHAAGVEDGAPWIAYAVVEDATRLSDLLAAGRREDALRVIAEAARGLAAAHALGIVHRDVKPDNVLVDAAGRARVVDFGIATAADLERLTRTGALVGTPAYMAPEVIQPGLGPVGPATDVWSLGVLLFEAAAGERPFGGTVSLAELAARIVHGEVPPLREEAPESSPALEAVCRRALERRPGDRYADAGALATDLEAALAGRRPPGAARPRGPALLALAAVAGAVAAAGAAVGVELGGGLERPAPSAATTTVEQAPPGDRPTGPPSPPSPPAAPPPTALERLLAEPPSIDTSRLDRIGREAWAGARAGDAESTRVLADCLRHGYAGLPEDPAAALHYYVKAAAAGDVEARALAANLLLEAGGRAVPADPDRAVAWLRDAAAGGSANAMVALARRALADEAGRDLEPAIRWAERAHAAGHPHAVDALVDAARRHSRGDPEDGVAPDPAAAARLWEAALALDPREPEACYFLGAQLASGAGVARDDARALALLEQAERLAHLIPERPLRRTWARYWQAVLRRGANDPAVRDPARARALLERVVAALDASGAARVQATEARLALADMLREGEGGPPGPAAARALYERVAADVRVGPAQRARAREGLAALEAEPAR